RALACRRADQPRRQFAPAVPRRPLAQSQRRERDLQRHAPVPPLSLQLDHRLAADAGTASSRAATEVTPCPRPPRGVLSTDCCCCCSPPAAARRSYTN